MQKLYSQALGLHQSGLFKEAEKLYRKILEKDPSNVETLNALGMLLNQTGEFKTSLDCLRSAASNARNVPHIQLNLSEALRVGGYFDEAEAAIRRALNLRSNYPEAWFCLGSLKHEQGLIDEAIALYKRTLNSRPNMIQAANALGVAYQESGDLGNAVNQFNDLINKNPNYADAHFNLGNTYLKLKNNWLAEKHYLAYEQLVPANSVVNLRLAEIALAKDITNMEEVSIRLARVERDFPESPELFSLKAQISMQQGRLEEARLLIKNAIDLDLSPPLILDYVRITKFKEIDAWLMDVVHKADQAFDDPQNKSTLNFALGKMYDDISQYDLAIDCYNKGNLLMAKLLPYNKAEEERKLGDIKSFFNEKFFRSRPSLDGDFSKLVFIVGMPRSGTTLLERVLVNHPKVKGAGELRKLFALQTSLVKKHPHHKGYPSLLAELSPTQMREISDIYIDDIESTFPGNYSRFVDKMPHNFLNIGLIAALFPNATIFNISRNKLDNCLSIYFEKFAEGHAYSYSFESLAHQFRIYQDLMAHWHKVLPGRIIDVSYEDLVESPEVEGKRCLDSIGLGDGLVGIGPESSPRLIKTASIWQARQPIYKTSVNRSDNYKKYLHHLNDLLEE